MPSNSVVISVENVSRHFRLIQERPDTLRELFSRVFRSRVQYHDFLALTDVSLTVNEGEMVGIVGRNGSGKSTLLKIIAGVFRPSAGQVTVKGTIAPLLELGAGMHPELTGRENIILNGLMMGFSKRDMREREASIIEFADIGEFIDSPVKQYSSGMYTRLAFAVATEVDPNVLIMDEILAVGDTQFQAKCFERLDRFKQRGKTMLLVTHSLDDVIKHCDRTIVLSHGRVVFDGLPRDAVDLYKNGPITPEYSHVAG